MNMAFAAIAMELPTNGDEVGLLPDGLFRAGDDRPKGLPGWRLNRATAQRIIAAAAARRSGLVIDYDHQTQNCVHNGRPAPAAGWFNQMVYREGEGLFARRPLWTGKARAMIAAREYGYLSPAFSFDPGSGEVTQILCAALTNGPYIDAGYKVALRARPFIPSLPELSESELAVCRHMGIDVRDYVEARSTTKVHQDGLLGEASAAQCAARSSRSNPIPNGKALSADQMHVCRVMGISPSDFQDAL